MAKTTQVTEVQTSPKTEPQDTFVKSTATSDTPKEFAENLIDYNTAVIKRGEELAQKAYDNYLSNLATAFDSAKALTKTTNVADFYKVASSNYAAAYDQFLVQGKELAELSAKDLEENTASAKKTYSQARAA